MLKEKVAQALNEQVNAEFYSAYLYLSMAASLETMGLPGFANWMRIQNQEETSHGMKIYDHIVERGGVVTLTAIDAPPTQWSDVMSMFQDVLKHEQHVTQRIDNLADLALQEKDHATGAFLQWFINEQVEEEAHVDEILQQLKLAQDSKGALFMMDKEMSTRVFVPPTAEGGA